MFHCWMYRILRMLHTVIAVFFTIVSRVYPFVMYVGSYLCFYCFLCSYFILFYFFLYLFICRILFIFMPFFFFPCLNSIHT